MQRFPQSYGAMLFIAVSPLCVGYAVNAQTRIDLRHSHDVRQILSTGLNYKETPDFDGRKVIDIERSDLVFILPGGLSLQVKARRCSLTVNANGKIRTLTLHGQILPDEEAYQVALKLHQAFTIPTDRLEGWRLGIVGKGRDAPTFSTGKKEYYPHIFIGMQSSMNTLYPWYLMIELGWNAEADDTRDERWGDANNPRPPEGLERVSIDSPSGRTYDRKDAYVHLFKAQQELDEKLGQKRDSKGRLISSPISSVTSPSVLEKAGAPLWSKVFGILSLLLSSALVWWFLRSKKR